MLVQIKPKKEKRMVSIKTRINLNITSIILGIILGALLIWTKTNNDNTTGIYEIFNSINLNDILSRYGIWILIALSLSMVSNTPINAVINILLFSVFGLLSYYLLGYLILHNIDSINIINSIIIVASSIIFAYIFWYANGEGIISMFLGSIILGFLFSQAFDFGVWYFNVSNIAEIFFMLIGLFFLHNKRNNLISSIFYVLPQAVLFEFLFKYII